MRSPTQHGLARLPSSLTSGRNSPPPVGVDPQRARGAARGSASSAPGRAPCCGRGPRRHSSRTPSRWRGPMAHCGNSAWTVPASTSRSQYSRVNGRPAAVAYTTRWPSLRPAADAHAAAAFVGEAPAGPPSTGTTSLPRLGPPRDRRTRPRAVRRERGRLASPTPAVSRVRGPPLAVTRQRSPRRQRRGPRRAARKAEIPESAAPPMPRILTFLRPPEARVRAQLVVVGCSASSSSTA